MYDIGWFLKSLEDGNLETKVTINNILSTPAI